MRGGGLPDREWGERVTAFIVPKPGFSLSPEELKGFMKSRLSAYKVPKEFISVNELPKSPTGKILKRKLQEQGERAGRPPRKKERL